MDAQQPQQTQASQFEMLVINNQRLDALDKININVSPIKGFVFGDVAMYEITDLERLDDKGKPNGETYKAAILTLKSGKEIELTAEENKTFFIPLWNRKAELSHLTLQLI
jgi:hypothetical protein